MITEATLQAGFLSKVVSIFTGLCEAMSTSNEVDRIESHLKTLFTRVACAADVYSDQSTLMDQAIPDLTSFLLQFLSQNQIWSGDRKDTQEMKLGSVMVLNRALDAYKQHRDSPKNIMAVKLLEGQIESATELTLQTTNSDRITAASSSA